MAERGNGEGSIRQRADGTWEARVSLPNGKRKSIYGKTRRDVQDRMKVTLRDADAGINRSIDRLTVADFLDIWINEVARPSIRLHLKPQIGSIRLQALTPSHVQRMMNDLTAAGLSPKTVHNARALLRSAANYAVSCSYVPRNVAAGNLVRPPQIVRDPIRPLSAQEVRDLINYARANDPTLGSMLTVATLTGLRYGELIGLTWDDLDLSGGTLRVRQTVTRLNEDSLFGEPKTNRSARTLSLPESARIALFEHRDRQQFERKAAGDRWQEFGLVFSSRVGTPLEPRNANRRLHRLLKGLRGFHALRHCCASLLLSQGVPMRVVMEQLGHSQMSLTSDLYSHVAPAMLGAAAEALESAVKTG